MSRERGPIRSAFERCGQRAYEAWQRELVEVMAARLPWGDLSSHVRAAWIEAAAAAIGEDQMRKDEAPR